MEIDNLTIILLSTFACLLIYYRFFSKPEPLVHPLLLGKQSEVSSVRKQGESGVYRSWATGQGTPLTVRPANAVKTVHDIVHGPKPGNLNVSRHILGTELSDDGLAEITRLIPLALSSLFDLSTNPTSPTPILTLLPPSPSTALPLLLLSLSLPPSAPLIVLPSPILLTSALKTTCHPQPSVVVIHASLAEDALEQVWEDCGTKVSVLVVGDPEKTKEATIADARSRGMNVRYWEEIWELEDKVSFEKNDLPDAHFNDIHSYYYSDSGSDVDPIIVKVTHMNLTAGIASLLSLFPADKRPSNYLKDVVASAIPLDTPLGMTIALATVWSGASFRLIGDVSPVWPETHQHQEDLESLISADNDHLRPTILFLTPEHHSTLLSFLQRSFLRHPLAAFAARHKLHHITSGHISRDTWLDKWFLNGTREKVLNGVAGSKLRVLITVGDTPPTSALAMSHLLLSLPFTRLHQSPFSAGPVFVSHFYDLQTPSIPHIFRPISFANPESTNEKSHTGPPSINTEVMLKGDRVAPVEGDDGRPLQGEIWIRGPSVLERIDKGRMIVDGWTGLGRTASVQTNGTFIVHTSEREGLS